MKQPKKLTRDQKQIVFAHRLNPNNWMLAEETEFYLKLINKENGRKRSVDKFYKGGKTNGSKVKYGRGNSSGLAGHEGKEEQISHHQ